MAVVVLVVEEEAKAAAAVEEILTVAVEEAADSLSVSYLTKGSGTRCPFSYLNKKVLF
jgi:hypothetical protein